MRKNTTKAANGNAKPNSKAAQLDALLDEIKRTATAAPVSKSARLQSLLDEIKSQDEDMRGELLRLTSVVQLAAFACEARRTLEGYANGLAYFPQAQEVCRKLTPAINNWRSMPDVCGPVLDDAAINLDFLGDKLADRVYRVADVHNAKPGFMEEKS